MSDQASKEWSVEGVLHQLESHAATDKKAAMQVFIKDSIPASDVKAAYEQIVQSALPGKRPDVGELRGLARSFIVRGDIEELTRIAYHPDVGAVLPSEVADVLPKPMGRKPA